MAKWKIWCFVSLHGRNDIHHWYETQSAAVQANFDTALDYLREQPITGWVRPKASKLAGNPCRHFYEIRIKANNTQHRPLGYFGPGDGRFTIVFCATEKDKKFVPKDACEQAKKRKDLVDADPSHRSCRCFCSADGADCVKAP
jgi:hypothetical protein